MFNVYRLDLVQYYYPDTRTRTRPIALHVSPDGPEILA